jgi:hypothetical protein
MNLRSLLAPLLLALFCASPLFAEVPPDVEAMRVLTGEWKEPPEPPVVSASTTYKADGTLSGSATFTMPAGKITIIVDGKWRVEHGVIIEEVTRSSHPQFVPVGAITHDTLLSLTDKECRYRTEDGKEVTSTRAAATEKPAPATAK